MPQIKYSVTINSPIGRVFRYVVDVKNAQKWQPDVRKAYDDGEALRIGAIISQDRSTRLLQWRLDLNADVIEYRPNKLVEYKGALGRFSIHGRLEFESSRRTTTVTESIDVRMGCMYFMFSPLMGNVMQRRTRKTLETLKNVLESEAEEPDSSEE